MKSIVLTLFSILFLLSTAQSQTSGPTFNLDFEEGANTELPTEWFKMGHFNASVDKSIFQSGKQSGFVESAGSKEEFGGIGYGIPSKYIGKEITLSGYIKIENVSDGFVGLMLRLDGKSQPMGFDNMQDRQITGTHDWKMYTVTLPYSEKVDRIIVGGLLVGKGKAWFDNFEVTIDGKTVQGMPVVEKPKAKADLDNEFEEASNVDLGTLNQEEEYRLYTLGRVWGLLKYHHPEIARGNYNWDNELFRILPYLKEEDFSNRLKEWIVNIGPVADVNPTKNADKKYEITVDHSWINENSFLSKGTKNLLHQIINSKKEDEHYYYAAERAGNPSFENERLYKNMNFEDDGMRILSLFRYWAMVEYFFPYKHLMDKDWDNTLRTAIPQMMDAKDGLAYKLVVLNLIYTIQDTHANIWMRDEDLNDFYGKFGASIGINWIEEKWVVTRFFTEFDSTSSMIAIGDIVTHVNGVDIQTLAAEKIAYCPASNVPTQMRDVAKRLLRTNETALQLTLKNENGTFEESVSTILNEGINYWGKGTLSHNLIDGNIGYIYPGALETDEIHDIMEKFENTRALIVDLRSYPSDFLVYKLAQYLLPSKTEFAKFTEPSIQHPGSFSMTEIFENGSDNPEYYKGKVFILINETTQSQAEYTTMALRNAPKATVIGSTTAGADGNVSMIRLPGGIRTMFSGIGVYYPDGTETQRIGIVPDIQKEPTIEGIRSGKDELLELAIKMSSE
ncbi:MAG: S41 family peptidase [Saprospiraceae bacterium]|nr:S41 family peptidase [Saprospiraceae bacterium]